MQNIFLRHPASVGETYGQHLRRAVAFAGWMALGAVCCLVHAVLPCLFERTGSNIISRLYERMVINRSRLPGGQAPRSAQPAPNR